LTGGGLDSLAEPLGGPPGAPAQRADGQKAAPDERLEDLADPNTEREEETMSTEEMDELNALLAELDSLAAGSTTWPR
jgi:hypothetical protein